MELELLGLFALGFAVGTYGTIVGFGGGFALVPLLIFLYPDYRPEQFTAISLAVVWANTMSGSIAYARQGRVDYRTGAIFAAASVPGVAAGALVVGLVPERTFTLLFAAMLLSLAAIALKGEPRGIRAPLAGAGVIVRTVEVEGRTYRYAYRLWQGILLSAGVGFASSLFGIGGGPIHVPAMISLLHFPVQFAVATSQFILVFMSGGATLIHLASGALAGDDVVKAIALGAGTVPGAQAGAAIAARMKGRTILLLLTGTLVVLSARLFLKGLADV